MKRILVAMMALAMVFSMVACGSTKNGEKPTDSKASQKVDVDMSAYPTSFDSWTIENMMAYLKAAGICVKDDWMYVQNEDECLPAETGISKVGSYMSDDEDGEQCLMVFWFDPAAEQTAVKEQLEYIRTKKTCNEAFQNQPIDHTVGNFAFCYSVVSLDDDFVSAIDAAYENLVTNFKLEPAF